MPPKNSLTRGIGRDAAWTSLTLLLSTAASFALLGYTVRQLGTADFGVFAIISSVTALLAVADFSFGTAVVRSTARAAAASSPGERDAARDDVATAHAALVATGLLVALVSIPTAYLLPAVTRVPSGRVSAAVVCTLLVSLATAIGLGSASLSAVVRGSRQFAVLSMSTLVGIGVRFVLVVILIDDLGLVSLGIAQLASVCVERGAQALWIRQNVQWFRCRPRRIKVAALRQAGAFAVPLVILSVDAQIVAASDAIIIGAVLGASGAALYRIGSAIPKQVAGALLTAFTASFPSLTSIADHAEQVALMRTLTRVVAYLGGLAFAFAALFRRDLVLLLLGQPSATAEAVLLLLSVTFVLDIGVHGMVLVLMARGRPWIMAVLSPVQLSMNLLLTVVLVKTMGPEGAAAAALVTLGIIDLVLFPLVARHEFVPSPSRIIALDAMLPTAFGGAVCVLATAMVRYSLDPSWVRVLIGVAVAALCGLTAGSMALRGPGRASLRAALQR